MPKKNRVGEIRIANNGMKMEVIEYFGTNDMTVKFEDNTIVHHIMWNNFMKGKVTNPNYYQSRIGETKTMTCGLSATVTEYKDSSHITVLFENGITATTTYSCFKKGNIYPFGYNDIMQKIFYIENNNFSEVNRALANGAKVVMIQAVPQVVSAYAYAGSNYSFSDHGKEKGGSYAYVVLEMPQ